MIQQQQQAAVVNQRNSSQMSGSLRNMSGNSTPQQYPTPIARPVPYQQSRSSPRPPPVSMMNKIQSSSAQYYTVHSSQGNYFST